MEKTENNYKERIVTIPNVLSFIRICIIPLIEWLYRVKKDYIRVTIALLLSGFTDILDGFIARRFHMISNFGKVLDPLADKLTQGVVLLCLMRDFKKMWVPLILLIIKEIFMGITGYLVIKETGEVYGAEWYGKLTTSVIYATIIVHLLWHNIPLYISTILIIICIIIMVYSFAAYCIRNYHIVKEHHIAKK